MSAKTLPAADWRDLTGPIVPPREHWLWAGAITLAGMSAYLLLPGLSWGYQIPGLALLFGLGLFVGVHAGAYVTSCLISQVREKVEATPPERRKALERIIELCPDYWKAFRRTTAWTVGLYVALVGFLLPLAIAGSLTFIVGAMSGVEPVVLDGLRYLFAVIVLGAAVSILGVYTTFQRGNAILDAMGRAARKRARKQHQPKLGKPPEDSVVLLREAQYRAKLGAVTRHLAAV